MTEQVLQLVLRFFKVLADESRLRILGILAGGERSVEDLAALLDLRAPTVSHHLPRLRELGLVTMRAEGNTHLYRLDADALRLISRDVLSLDRVAAFADDLAPRTRGRRPAPARAEYLLAVSARPAGRCAARGHGDRLGRTCAASVGS